MSALLRVGQDGPAADERGHQEQHRQEGVATEDVADGELVVAGAGGGQGGGELGKGGGRRQHGGFDRTSVRLAAR
jgi:hypothetical protein